ncbi:lysine 2,3-aminomutase [Methanococcus aeolicus]|uniref:L-lysine 2,3-aminomutase n=1 Tax=Methanococcus aeolicus (strain ATCC BAA-1280 / DSM 17508 / OCM 812 / Nankai-3) TaxID=419665 RepID=A6UTK8_META3|nr:lysine 2,3-aminomutase [Methanococcus aeolicus]ABR55830.1 lysine 2,3-aminomutase YodO family protein [Methanococcus aeolicus Nankai-3]UXM84062.1 lysine 2,3-aminomutase [Methanococcus aeolicus]
MEKIFDKKHKDFAEKISKNIGLEEWYDWKWQLKNSIRDIDTFEEVIGIKFHEDEKAELQEAADVFPLSITPYYASLIDVKNFREDPIFKQSFVGVEELITENFEMADPLAEDKDSPVPGLTHRYPDRILFYISHACAVYCRHCTRKRKVGDTDSIPSKKQIEKGLDYIRNNPQIRDVLLSGGDPLLLPDDYLDWILTELWSIPHIEVIRIGTRVPVVLPYRITDELVNMLKKHHPLWINTHFNHIKEITKSSKNALRKLADVGIPLGNQSVLLRGVNDCPNVIKKLNQKLAANRVRPYYLFQCDLSEGLSHFRTSVRKGVEIIESLIGHTSGFAVPRYVVDAPGGGGKIPVMPNYVISWGTDRVILRNYEGVITTYKEPEHQDDCSKDCTGCERGLAEEGEEHDLVGIEKLLFNSADDTISLVPQGTERIDKRDNNG